MDNKNLLLSLYEATYNLSETNEQALDKIQASLQKTTKKPLIKSSADTLHKQELKELIAMKKSIGKISFTKDSQAYSRVYVQEYMPYFKKTQSVMLSRWEKDVKYIS